MPQAFQVETQHGVRMVEFDPDIFRERDVLILLDGRRIARMPYPKPSSPYSEAAFAVDGHPLVASAYLSAEPTPPTAVGLVCDVFAQGQSLTDGSSLAEFRTRAPSPGETYPTRFKVIDTTLQVAPVASTPGLSIGILGRASEVGWPLSIGLLALMCGAIGVATVIATRAWEPIRADTTRSVSNRTLRGCAAVLACYVLAGLAVLGLALFIGQNR